MLVVYFLDNQKGVYYIPRLVLIYFRVTKLGLPILSSNAMFRYFDQSVCWMLATSQQGFYRMGTYLKRINDVCVSSMRHSFY